MASCALMGALAAARGAAVWRAGPPGVWLAVAVTILAGLNLAWSWQPLTTARTLAVWLAGLLAVLYCAGGGAGGARSIRRGVHLALIVAGTALALHGLYQIAFGFERLADSQGAAIPEAMRARLASGRAVATLGLPGALAGMLSLTLPVTLGGALTRGGSRVARAGGWAACLIQGAGLLATRSAAGLVSLAVAAAAVAWWSATVAPVGRSRRRLAVLLVVAGLIGSAALLALRLASGGVEGSGPLALRAGNWMVATRIFLLRPVLGVGAGAYGIAFPAHRTWEMNESRYAHNTWLQLFSETGVALGGLALLGGALAAVALARRARSSEDRFAAAACLAFLLHNALDFTLYVPTVALAFFCLAGPTLAGATTGRPGPLARGATTLAALGLALFALWVTRGDLARQQALEAAGDPGRAIPLARAAIGRNPIDPDSHSILSHLLLDTASGRPEELEGAEEHALRAVELDPRTPHHWHHLGRVRLARGDAQGAYMALHRAAELYPIRIPYREDRDAVAAALVRSAGR